MSYAVQPPVAVPAPGAARPTAVTAAVALLWTLAVAGLVYAVGGVAVAVSADSRFRELAGSSEQVENLVSVIWLGAALAAVAAVVLLGLFVVLGLGLRRGNRIARGVTLGVCGIGALAGLGTLATIAVQRSGEALPGTMGAALGEAYPGGWIALNAVVAGVQVLGYLVVGVLVLTAPGSHFGTVAETSSFESHSAWTGAYSTPWTGDRTGTAPVNDPAAFPTSGAEQISAPRSDDDLWTRPAN
ncbi:MULTISPECIES: hypothetical protein [Actinoplanes]|uniref:hypothetical protein n=1 Tax=Actinoplanes TaxID=1865 RepID=UPI0005F2E456|nr:MULTISPECIES: hypothetical protein [Actinoplanes]GLY07226.1 hypothetical protein Acsp01_76050 [Actinoplanes sp. NBRC 101535]